MYNGYKIELRISGQDATSASFGPEKGNGKTLNTIEYQTAPLANCRLVGSYSFLKYSDLVKNAEKMRMVGLSHVNKQ